MSLNRGVFSTIILVLIGYFAFVYWAFKDFTLF